jgi:2-keto-4-pentenoate hydratase/2-oxohepta-3-ene-1,7-dioic acid hydratase in catechol pathway
MRLVSFDTPEGPNWGLLRDGAVVPSEALGADVPRSLMELLADEARWPVLLAELPERAAQATALPLADVTLLPCVPRPGKIICLGVNYIDHAKEGGNTIGDYPAIFLRCATSLLAHGAPLQMPKVSEKLDFEAELAVVIGRRTRFVTQDDALKSVFAYACFNDNTFRDYQRKTTQWTIGKNFDATGSFGPCLVTPDELPAGCSGVRIESRLNGQVMQSANTGDMAFGVARTIALLSESLTMEPGDVVVMGTPGGVGYARTPPIWMKPGDRIEVEIDGIGILFNEVVA